LVFLEQHLPEITFEQVRVAHQPGPPRPDQDDVGYLVVTLDEEAPGERLGTRDVEPGTDAAGGFHDVAC
jgi:hypothetical protein